MAEFPYTPVPTKLRDFFEHVQMAGVPRRKVTQKYLQSVGFKSKNDRTLLPVLKALGFLDSTGNPTDSWKAYRNRDEAPAVMASAVTSTYADLFETYPDAHRKDTEALRNFFVSRTDVADATLARMVQTFKTLCELAEFEAAPGEEEPTPAAAVGAEPTAKEAPTAAGGLTLNVNIELHLPATDDAAVYEKLFAALKKHVLS